MPAEAGEVYCALFAAFIRRETCREAVDLETTRFVAARLTLATAAFTSSARFAAFSSIAPRALFTAVRIFERSALLRAFRFWF